MIDSIAIIEERRFALLELNCLVKVIKTHYGDNPPMEIRITLSELAAMYRRKYGSNSDNKPKVINEAKDFCAMNGLPVV